MQGLLLPPRSCSAEEAWPVQDLGGQEIISQGLSAPGVAA